MDLNRLYFKHQLSMMLVSSAQDTPDRTYHQTKANGLARRIVRFQQSCGASAATARNSGGVTPVAAAHKTEVMPSTRTGNT